MVFIIRRIRFSRESRFSGQKNKVVILFDFNFFQKNKIFLNSKGIQTIRHSGKLSYTFDIFFQKFENCKWFEDTFKLYNLTKSKRFEVYLQY